MVTQDERPALLELAGGEAVTLYVRRLIAEDAQRRGIEWPDNLPAPALPRRK
jgi:hypothetical protein